jgi:hypothetical protein
MLIFWAVVGLRLFVPLLIPRWPLPGILLAWFIDAIDGSIFRAFTNLPMDQYQAYDKALDIYYLAIAYLATLRNWAHLFAFRTSRFLFYYRLVGVFLFNLSGIRALMLIFTNAFEYFFMYYEGVRVRWDPLRMSKRTLLGSLAFIVIFIKLPQEYIIHIAQVNMTNWVKTNLFGVSPETGWIDALLAAPGVTLAIVLVVVGLLLAARWAFKNKLPPPDWSPKFEADPVPPVRSEDTRAPGSWTAELLTSSLAEKIVLVALLVVIFAQILPGVQASVLELAVATAIIIAANALVSEWLSRRGTDFATMLREFAAMAVVNFGLVLLYNYILAPAAGADLDLGITLFFVLLLTLIVVYYDNFRPVFDRRFAAEATPSATA